MRGMPPLRDFQLLAHRYAIVMFEMLLQGKNEAGYECRIPVTLSQPMNLHLLATMARQDFASTS